MDSSTAQTAREERVSVVIATRDRRTDLERTLGHLTALPERPRVVVVDNASRDGTAAMVRRLFPAVEVLALRDNAWGAARTIGARHVDTQYVAFSDDDSWWAPGSLGAAADVLDSHPRLGLVAARVLVGSQQRLDPTCVAMASSPLAQSADLADAAILGFIACGSIVRRSAFLEVGGFDARLEIGGEEELLALDLAAAGWGLHYLDAVVAHHHPSPARDSTRRRRQLRNLLWSAWLRHPLRSALGRSVRVAGAAAAWDRAAAGALLDALAGLPWIVRARRKVPRHVEVKLAELET